MTHIHEEASEDHLRDIFLEFGPVMNLSMELDRRTGYVKVGGWVGGWRGVTALFRQRLPHDVAFFVQRFSLPPILPLTCHPALPPTYRSK